MDRVEENSARWGDDVNKFVGKTKKKVVMGGESSWPGFQVSCYFSRRNADSSVAVRGTLGF